MFENAIRLLRDSARSYQEMVDDKTGVITQSSKDDFAVRVEELKTAALVLIKVRPEAASDGPHHTTGKGAAR